MKTGSVEETHRLDTLNAYAIIGSPPEKEFDRIVELAAAIFAVPTALVGFTGENEHHFKARVGFDTCSVGRSLSLCADTVAHGDVLMIADTHADARYRDHPLVNGAPGIRFYAGAPLRDHNGAILGAVSVIDYQPRAPLTDSQCDVLRNLADLAMDYLARRRLLSVRRAALGLASSMPDAIICTDEARRVTFWNQAAERLSGLPGARALGMPFAEAVGKRLERALFGDQAADGMATHYKGYLRCQDGRLRAVDVSCSTWAGEHRYQRGFVLRDLSARQDMQDRLRYLRDFDRLTDLPNRSRFLELVQESLDLGRPTVVLKVGLDNFKAVNSSLGMTVGDAVLREAARRVSVAVPPGATVARLAGDEYGVLLVGEQDLQAVRVLSGVLIKEIARPFRVRGFECHVTGCVGMARTEDGQTLDCHDLLKRALLALQAAKSAGADHGVWFANDLGARAEKRHALEQELRDAFRHHRFEMHFQPQVSLADGAVIGAEALIRWRHQERGLIFPGDFIEVLEVSDFASQLGEWIIETCCDFAIEQRRRHPAFRIGINLFPCQLRDPRLVEIVEAHLARAGLPPDALELEITETTILEARPEVLDSLFRLRRRGVGIAFDDYGTGYASLSLLKKYPLSRLKIDRQFVLALVSSRDDLAIVKAIIALGHSLDLQVIAEGIEDEEQALLLTQLGCDEGQGYWFCRPVERAAFPA